MAFTFKEERELRAIDRAGQVALEYLRANQTAKVSEVVANYKQIFEEVYRKTTEVNDETE